MKKNRFLDKKVSLASLLPCSRGPSYNAFASTGERERERERELLPLSPAFSYHGWWRGLLPPPTPPHFLRPGGGAEGRLEGAPPDKQRT